MEDQKHITDIAKGIADRIGIAALARELSLTRPTIYKAFNGNRVWKSLEIQKLNSMNDEGKEKDKAN